MTDLSSPKLIKRRVIVYIDGFNLYEGLCEQGWRKYLWLNLVRFSETLLLDGQELICTKYFTARMSHPPDKEGRQRLFLDALATLPKLKCFYGKFVQDTKICRRCNAIVYYDTEKQTDVNIASEMLVDAFEDNYDTAILVSGDSDLCSPIAHIRRLYPHKTVIVAFPPQRESYELELVASAAYRTVKKKYRESQFPNVVLSVSRFELVKPKEWV